MEVFLSQVKLKGDSDFIRKFNYVSGLFAEAQREDLTEEQKTAAFNAWWEAKYQLESGSLLVP